MEGVLCGSLPMVGQTKEQSKCATTSQVNSFSTGKALAGLSHCELQQTDPRSPDFKHKITKESLWVDGRYNPHWVKNMLEKIESAGVHNKAQQVREYTGWEMLSLEEALASLEGMPQPPSAENLACILHECRRKKSLPYALSLHAYLCKHGLETHRLLGNYLVPILVAVGSMCNAQQVFDRLVDRNEYSWTSLITGYIECGKSQHALILYQKMQNDLINPSVYTFVALLKACGRLKDAQKGREIHAEIASKGLERDLFVGSTLVDMYAKCGILAKAQEVFDELPVRNEVSWNALITGYANHGLGLEALNYFEQMQIEGLSLDVVSFVCGLKACGSIGAIKMGQEIHAEIARRGFERDLFVGSTLVDMYAKCGVLAKAQEVFDKLSVRNEVSWNALIAGYADHTLGGEALNCFDLMQLEGVCPDAVTFACSLKACGRIGAVNKGKEIHAQIARTGFLEENLAVVNALIDMYAKCGLPAKAREAFDKLPVRDVVSWNALITGYAKHGLGEEALKCLKQMRLEGISPDAVTFVCSLKACGSIGAVDEAREIHSEIARTGLSENHIVLGNTLVDMYANCGLSAEAQQTFDELPVRDIVSWNALIVGYADQGLGEEALKCVKQMQLEGVTPDSVTFLGSLKACASIGATDRGQEIHAEIVEKGWLEIDLVVGSTLVDMYAKCGLLGKAREVFDQLPVQNEVSWTALIAGYAEYGLGQDALNCFEQMQLEGISPDAVTYVCGLKACGSIGSTDRGQDIHVQVARKGLLETNPLVGNTLIDMYAKWGLLLKAREVFDKLPAQNEVSWNALMAGYAHLGQTENVFYMFEKMRVQGIKPDEVTFLNVLSVCNHAGLVDQGQMYFEAMSKDYGITPSLEHYACIVDLLGRAGQLDEAVAMMKKMPFHPNLVVWHNVLNACRKWGNVELGWQAFEHAVRVDEKDVAAYVLMSNIYANAHRQDTG